jgi:hypothetical protein
MCASNVGAVREALEPGIRIPRAVSAGSEKTLIIRAARLHTVRSGGR